MGAGRAVPISLDGVRDKNLMQLKKLNTVLFPVRYNDKYYADALASGEFTKLGSSFLASGSSLLPYLCSSDFLHFDYFLSWNTIFLFHSLISIRGLFFCLSFSVHIRWVLLV